jgi:hypothetical protein
VTERDAFGNLIPEPGAPVPVPVPSGDPLATAMPADEQDTPPPPPAPPPLMAGVTIPTYGPSKRGLGGRLIGLLVTVAFIAPFAIGGWIAYNAFTTAKTVNTVVKGVRDFATSTTADGRTTETKASTPPRGVSGASMLSPANFGRALRAARRDPGGQLGLLRLAPERADFQLNRHGGGLDLLQLRYDGDRSLIRPPGSAGARTAIIFSKVDRQAPSRLVRQAAKRLGRSTKSIDYVVLIDILGGPRWSAYFKGGAAFQGDAHGRVTRRIQ